jgi:hypothetical protein
MEWRPGTMAFTIGDAKALSEAMAPVVLSTIKEQFNEGKDAQGRSRPRKKQWTVTDRRGKKRKMTAKGFEEMVERILDGDWPGKAPRKPKKSTYYKGKGKRRVFNQERYDQALVRWEEAKAHHKRQQQYARRVKKQFTNKGKTYYPHPEAGVIFSELLYDSLTMNKPQPPKRWNRNGQQGYRNGRMRISASAKRQWVIEKQRLFDYNDSSPVARALYRATIDIARRGVVTRNYNRRIKNIKRIGRIAARGWRFLDIIAKAAARTARG